MKLTVNSLAGIKTLSNLNISCGYSYIYGMEPGAELNPNNSWHVKLFSKLEKNIPFLNKIPEGDQQFLNAISNSAKFLNEQYDGSDHIEDMHIVMNVNSTINNFIKKNLKRIHSFNPAKALQLFHGTNTNVGHIQVFH